MQFHHHGYVSTDPRIKPASGVGVDRSPDLPDTVDVLIVGAGPAGMLTFAQMSQFDDIVTVLVEKRGGRLEIGQADGIQARSVETFQAFGFAPQIIQEAYRITEMNFWKPDPEDPSKIVRAARTDDDATGISEFPHLIVNQARVLDYYAEAAHRAPSRGVPSWGWEFLDLEIGEGEYPVAVRLRGSAGDQLGQERTVHAKYVLGADGARSGVRRDIGAQHVGHTRYHAWGVMDVLADTDFPDVNLKCAIHSEQGSILHIPREGGHLFRSYVDLGEVAEDDNHAVRKTPLEVIIKKCNEIMVPYTVDVKNVAWWSVYEVGHRVTDRFDDVPVEQAGEREPHVFIAGDACHTHSAKAGQGMNVSMQDGFNLGWKLAYVLKGLAPASLLSTYSAERQEIAQNLIDFDTEWSTMMAKKPEDFESPTALEDFYTQTMEFPAGFMTQYKPSQIIASDAHQDLAAGYPVGKRFKSSPAIRVSDANPIQIGHMHEADGRFRLYVFADFAHPKETSKVDELGAWLQDSPDSPITKYTPRGKDRNALFDVKVIYQQSHHDFDLTDAHDTYLPRTGPFRLRDRDGVWAAGRCESDIFEERQISRDGAVVVVRPDQYVAAVLPLDATEELAAYFDGFLLDQNAPAR